MLSLCAPLCPDPPDSHTHSGGLCDHPDSGTPSLAAFLSFLVLYRIYNHGLSPHHTGSVRPRHCVDNLFCLLNEWPCELVDVRMCEWTREL